MSRDDFLAKTKIYLARRVGCKCSICSVPTSGLAGNLKETISLGEAGHIQGAALWWGLPLSFKELRNKVAMVDSHEQ